MKKKEFFWSLLTVMMVAMLSVGIVSCSKDDKNDESNPSSKVIGTWSVRDGNESLTLTFKSGGVGTSTYKYYSSYSGMETETETFTYEMEDESKGIILMEYYDSYSGYQTDIVYFEIRGNKMYIYEEDYGDELIYVLTKQ